MKDEKYLMIAPQATNGTLEAIQAHINGLQKMVKMQGGLQNSMMNEYTIRLILWYFQSKHAIFLTTSNLKQG